MTTAPLVVTDEFYEQLDRNSDWLIEQGHEDWMPRLAAELEDAYQLLSEFPAAGVQQPPTPLRKLLLRTLPFALWYAVEGVEPCVVLLSFRHFRQRGPR